MASITRKLIPMKSICPLALFCAVIACPPFLPQAASAEPGRRLSDIATRQPRFEGDFYGWLSNDSFLLARVDRDNPRGVLFKRELASGRETALPALTKLYNQADGGCILQISPDGRWVFWWTGKIHEVAIHVSRLDGSGHLQVAKAKADTDNLDVFWLSDSRRFVELAMPRLGKFTRALVRHVEKPDVVEELPIAESNPLQDACAVAGREVALAGGDRLIALPCSLHGYGPIDANDAIGDSGLLIGKGAGDQRSPIVPPPKSNAFCGAALGPRCDRIAWLVASASDENETRVGLWTTRLDGRQWTPVGFEATGKPDTGFGEHLETFMAEAPGSVRWLPDGKSLSFFYKGDLYTVPAPGQ